MQTALESLLKKYRLRPLDPTRGYKPLDFGGKGINGSVNRDGRIIAINFYHPIYGYATLTSAPPFDETQRYNPEAVRRYRHSLTKLDGFGLMFHLPIVQREAWLVEDALPYIRLTLGNGVVADCITFVPEYKHMAVAQVWAFSESGKFARMTGKLSLQRCAYTQLTEGGPVAMPSSKTTVYYDRPIGAVGFQNDALDIAVFMSTTHGLEENQDGSIAFKNNAFIYPQINEDASIPASKEAVFKINIAATSEEALFGSVKLADPKPYIEKTLTHWQQRWENNLNDDLIQRRALVYGLNCCVPINDQEICILTDHMLLPLSWNRDAYYVAMALLHWHEEMAVQVEGHLKWMFERAERIDGLWGRSYMANGKIKDAGFQLDQQLFPLLELAEYTLKTEDLILFERLLPRVKPVIDTLLSKRAGTTWLFPTDETPADDPIAYPYHLSSHILFWHMLTTLAEVDSSFDYKHIAKNIYDSIHDHFLTTHHDITLYAYATDGQGNHHLYHDANDTPLAYVPNWKFLPHDDPVWRATMDFAFSSANPGGYYGGHLGSVHTKAAWPLGDVQELIYALTIGDSDRIQEVRDHLGRAAQWDGALPEAYDPSNYSVTSRHWFAWPNALFFLAEQDS